MPISTDLTNQLIKIVLKFNYLVSSMWGILSVHFSSAHKMFHLIKILSKSFGDDWFIEFDKYVTFFWNSEKSLIEQNLWLAPLDGHRFCWVLTGCLPTDRRHYITPFTPRTLYLRNLTYLIHKKYFAWIKITIRIRF